VADDVARQLRRRLRQARGGAWRAEAAAPVEEGAQLVVATVTAAQPQQALGEVSAFEEGVKLVLHIQWQCRAGDRKLQVTVLRTGPSPAPAIDRFGTAGSRNCGPQTGHSGRVLEREQSGNELVWGLRV
jgi:hypothetical protein